MNRFILFLTFFLTTCLYGQKTIFIKERMSIDSVVSTQPIRDVVSTDEDVMVTYIFPVAVIQQDPLYEGCYWWKVEGFGINEEEGTPATLSRIDRFVIPFGKGYNIELIDSEYEEYHYKLVPAHPAIFDDEVLLENTVRQIDTTLGVYPQNVVSVESTQKYRDCDILNVKICPIQYDCKRGIVRAFTKLKYRIVFEEKVGAAYLQKDAAGQRLPLEDDFLRNNVLNTRETIMQKAVGLSSYLNNQTYLILSVAKYERAVRKFAEWKKLMGFNVKVVLRPFWIPETVKNEVQALYKTDNKFYYLLIIGDYEDVPAETSSLKNVHVTDFFYGCMDGEGDYMPDIYCGRISVSSLDEAEVVVDKVISYEKNPIVDDAFYNTGVNCAYFQDNGRDKGESIDGYADRRFAQTSEDVRNYLLTKEKKVKRIYAAEASVFPTNWNNRQYSNGEEIPEELRKPAFPWNGNSVDIVNAINDGAFYVLHRDHGSYTGWGTPSFKIKDINTLSNGNKLPVVFSMNCQTGKFSQKLCFTEAFLRKKDGGCVAIYGATDTSYSGYNDVLTGGMFDAIWPYPGLSIVLKNSASIANPARIPCYRLGNILAQAMARIGEVYEESKETTRYTKEIFHCFGDPSMQIYTSQPTSIMGVFCRRGTDRVVVTIPRGKYTIAFYDLSDGSVNAYVGNSVTHLCKYPQNVTVCISAHDNIPYIDEGNSYIQNETIEGNKYYRGETIKVGAEVTEDKTYGPVIFKNGSVTFSGKEVQFHSGTTILEGVEIKVEK